MWPGILQVNQISHLKAMFKSLDKGLSCTGETIEKTGFTEIRIRVILTTVKGNNRAII